MVELILRYAPFVQFRMAHAQTAREFVTHCRNDDLNTPQVILEFWSFEKIAVSFLRRGSSSQISHRRDVRAIVWRLTFLVGADGLGAGAGGSVMVVVETDIASTSMQNQL